MSKKTAMAAFADAQTKETDAITAVHDLDAQLQAAVRTESEAAVAAIDGNTKPLAAASKEVRDLEQQLRIAKIQAAALTDRRKEASVLLDEANAEAAHAEAEGAYQQYIGAVSRLRTALADANATIQAVRVRAEEVQSQYRATGQRELTLHTWRDRLRQTVVNELSAVDLLEKSNSTPDLLGPVAAYVSAIGAGGLKGAA